MKRVLLATTAVAAFVAFSGLAQAQDPGRSDYGATEGGGKAGSAFTVTVGGDISFFLKYATGDSEPTNDGLFALISGETHINGAATTDNGTDIETHLEIQYSGIGDDNTDDTVGSSGDEINVGDILRVDELSMKVSGNWGSVEMGANDGAEDSLKIYGASVAAGTGGTDGFAHGVDGSVSGSITSGGTAGSGDSSDALKVTYVSPNVAGFQAGLSVNYQTEGPNDVNGGTLGVGLGAKYAGSGGGLDYAVSLVWGDNVSGDTSANAAAEGAFHASRTAALEALEEGETLTAEETSAALAAAETAADGAAQGNFASDAGGLGIGVKLGGAGVSGALGVTIDKLARDKKVYGPKVGPDLDIGAGVGYAIPGGKANVSLTTVVRLPYGADAEGKLGNNFTEYLVFVSADYAVLPGVTLALDLGYGDSEIHDSKTATGGFTGAMRTKAAF